MLDFWVRNLIAYSLQIAAIAAAGALALRLLRIRMPRVRLLCGHALIAACLVLPAMQPWRVVQNATSGVQISSGPATVAGVAQHSGAASVPVTKLALLLIAAGIAIRLGMLGAGFWRLRRYRRGSDLVPGAFQALQLRMGVFAEVRISNDVSGPVTFGLRRPVILMPEACLADEAIACHELIHVRRRDWLFTVLEECVLAVFWFHPALWWLVAEVQLAREEAVDREVVAIINSREQYLESLLALAVARAGFDLVPASPFLRKRHLRRRVAALLKEVSMSRLRLSSSMAAFAATLAIACWLGVKAFPLQAAPQEKIDAPGVTVQAGALTLLHRAPVVYPEQALAKRIQGTVVVELSLSETGTVTDARVLSGPEELRKAALQSVLQWHYANDARATAKTQVSVDFQLPPEADRSNAGRARVTAPPPPPPPSVATVDRVILNVPDELKQKLQGRLTLHEGDQLTGQAMADLYNAVNSVDEHLRLNIQTPYGQKGTTVTIQVENASPAQPAGPGKLRIGGNVAAVNLIHKVTPMYPPLAKQARIQGVVRFNVTIGKDGSVLDIQLVSGHPLLAESAKEAVAQWMYKPTLLNGDPVEVMTQVDVNFTLSESPAPAPAQQ